MYSKDDGVYLCKRLRILEWLDQNGYKPFGVTTDRFNQNMSVWLFKNSPQLYNTVQQYYENRP